MNNTYRIKEISEKLDIAGFFPLDVLVIGSTGAGKSSTMNALFQSHVSKVGEGCDPETMKISSYRLNNLLRFWDSPGLGDGIAQDYQHSKKLVDLLYEEYRVNGRPYGLIDTVLVILDGSGRDMGTTYRILNEIVVPNFPKNRIFVALNQADMAMKGRHWDNLTNQPDSHLQEFLDEKVKSIQKRVLEATGVSIHRPVYYSANKEYNVDRLMDMIIDYMPTERRRFM